MLLNALSLGADADVYEAQPVNFDGTNDYLTRGADLTGVADTKVCTASYWMRTSSATTHNIYSSTTNRARIVVTTRTAHTARDVNGIGIFEQLFTMALRDGAWHHILFSFDLTNTSKRHLYIDNIVRSASYNAHTNSNVDWSRAEHSIGAETNGASKVNGDLADVWIDQSAYMDLSVLANRRKFISATGKPVYLGGDGSLPTGTAPIMFFSGPTVAWHTNKGSGGGFTENGALTDGSGGVEL